MKNMVSIALSVIRERLFRHLILLSDFSCDGDIVLILFNEIVQRYKN